MSTVTRRAVIDLGTNTFHLLIADVSATGGISEIYRERIFVKLAAEGIATIGKAPFARGIKALRHFRIVLDEHDVPEVNAIGTAALRTAANGKEFIREAAEKSGINIQLIDGDQEAQYITLGVLNAIPAAEDRVLIMDIGGGSTEFIIADERQVYWRRSFPLGVSVLMTGFHFSDPISGGEVSALENHLKTSLTPLREALATYPTTHLVGAAGTFDVLAERLQDTAAPRHTTSHQLNIAGFGPLYERIVGATLAERLALPDVPEERADMIVVAMILLRFVSRLAGIDRITVSDYAMKEGILLARPQDAK
ncbi:phosphatase [Neolewinella aurantiaca]|uniref:Phosphatase n=1 Tax=Neolewinella aurantiaca TaxID=2602767 RepID=A0A5C7FIN4_9BACT|nr:phosphatase [Neolewinella aurantiaca]TXF84022.1 phosphatase [Neolewinella aurantiaca]